MIVDDDGPSRCARCGHVQLLLLVFTDGLYCRARVGCSCTSFPLYRDEVEQIVWSQDELIAPHRKATAARATHFGGVRPLEPPWLAAAGNSFEWGKSRSLPDAMGIFTHALTLIRKH